MNPMRFDDITSLAIYAECDPDTGLVNAVSCQGPGWQLREAVVDGEFDIAFSRLLADLRVSLQLTAGQMQALDARRHAIEQVCLRPEAA